MKYLYNPISCMMSERISYIWLLDWSNNRTTKVADHALVFMLRGLNTNGRCPYLIILRKKKTNTAQLIRCIKEHVHKISKAGFHIVAIICDQGASNTAAIKKLILQTNMKFRRKNTNDNINFNDILLHNHV